MEENVEPLKMSIDDKERIIKISKGYSSAIDLTMEDCRIIGVVYERILKEKQDGNG
jgi:hypothetical protein